MTDYIELMLEQEECEESLQSVSAVKKLTGERRPGAFFQGRFETAPRPVLATEEQTAGDKADGEQSAAPLSKVWPPAKRDGKGSRSAFLAEKSGEAENARWEETLPVARAAQREYSAAGILRMKIRQAEVAAGYRGETAAPAETEKWGFGKEHSVLELDAAFQRDARRYDNGFELL